jgi:hypothetical protein
MPVSTMPAGARVLAALLAGLFGITLLGATAAPAEAHYGASRWECLAHYESGHRWAVNTGNGYYGGLQFSLSTWRHYGGPQYSGNIYPNYATRAEQIVDGPADCFRGVGCTPTPGRLERLAEHLGSLRLSGAG